LKEDNILHSSATTFCSLTYGLYFPSVQTVLRDRMRHISSAFCFTVDAAKTIRLRTSNKQCKQN